MSFLHPEFLYYMLPPLFILFLLLLTQKEAQATFFSEEVMDKLRVSANTLTLKARNALFMLIGVLMIIALAGPVIEDGKVEIKAKSSDIMIALDISDSMLAEDVYPNRLKLAKQKVLELLRIAPNERIGIIAFAKNSYLVSPLSFDHEAVSFLLRQLSTNSITEKGTNFLSMLEVVDKSIKKDSKRYLLILSDGGDKKDFSKEIEFAKKHDISVFVLGVGTKKGAPIKLENGEFIKQDGNIIVSKLNEDISTLATKTGGVYIESVNSNDDVKAMLSEIEKHSKKKELKSQEIARFIPLFYYPLGLALFILLIATSSMSKRQNVNLPGVFLLAVIISMNTNLNAGLFDFMELKEAKEAYESKDYAKSAEIYKSYANSSSIGESHYNAGNALYKQGKYKEAISEYKKAKFDTKEARAKNFANMGNAYAKEPTQENLKKAIEAYKESLKLQDDKDTKENLESVKKALKKQEKQNQKNKSDKNKNSKEKSDDNKKNKSKQSDKSKRNDKNKDKNSQDKDNGSKDDKSSKDKSGKNDMKSKEPKKDKENKDKQSGDSKDDKNKKNEKEKSSNKDKVKKLEDKKKESNSNASSAQDIKEAKMSDAEEAKWLKELNKQQNTYLYMLNKPSHKEENTNEKPW
jgi:Ca-activated chloride channel family protein